MRKAQAGTKTVVIDGIVVGQVTSTGDMARDAEAARDLLKSKGIHLEISRFQAILNQAVGFTNTSAYLYERDLRRSPFNGVSAAPFVVNAAFGIELYLKALAAKDGVLLRGHELVKLYESLPRTAQQEIDAVIPKCAASRKLGEPPRFLAYLTDLNNTFVDWRYSYEAETPMAVHIEPTIFVMQVLHEACHLPPAA